MKRIKKYSSFGLMGLLLLVGCYDDEGNYEYHEVNEVSIELPKQVGVRLSKSDSVLVTIEPKLSQTLTEQEDQLTYTWEKEVQGEFGLMTKWVECGKQKTCEFWLQPNDVNAFSVRVRVLDNRKDGSEWYKQTMVKPIVPYSRSWFVLQNQEGKSVLGAVDGEGSGAVVVADAYQGDMGTALPVNGTPKFLMTDWDNGSEIFIHPRQPMVFIGTDQEIYHINAVSFQKIYSYSQMLHYKVMNGNMNFAPDWIQPNVSQSAGDMVSDNGKVYMANADGYFVFYPVGWESGQEDGGSYRVTKAVPVFRKGYILYDEENHRFLKCTSYDDLMVGYMETKMFRDYGMPYYFYPDRVLRKLSRMGENANKVNAFNPDNIGDDKVLMDMNMYKKDGEFGVLATFFSTKDGKVHVYDLNTAGYVEDAKTAICVGEYTFDLPAGMRAEEVHITASREYGKTIFIAGGNQIYKVDCNRPVPKLTLLYAHPNATVRMTGLKFKNEYYDMGANVDPQDYNSEWIWYGFGKSIGASLDYGGNEGGILELKLTVAGEVDRDSEVLEYKGFGKIVDFAYSAKP